MTPEKKIGVMFTPFEMKTLIKILEEKEEELFTSDKKSEAEVYNTLAVQLESILHKALENKDSVEKPETKWVSPQDPGDEQPLPKEEYIQSVQPELLGNKGNPIISKGPTKIVRKMEEEYPETMDLFRIIINDQYILFANKQADYGPGNISMNGNKDLALLGLGVRMNDKTQRILNITHNNKEPNNESLIDSFKDLSVYGVIAQIVLADKWGK